MQQDATVRAAIAGIGRSMGAEVLRRCTALFAPEQDVLAAGLAPAAVDLAYGPYPRQRLDLYLPASARTGSLPTVVWVHGGGFARGEKSSAEHPFNAHVGRWAARQGLLGVVMNYRLLPEARWPSGGEDVGLALDWLRGHISAQGGDPQRIILCGTSAGAAHIATCLQLRSVLPGVRGAVLLSGLYGATAPEAGDLPYFGADDTAQAWQKTLPAVAASSVPLFVACAQYDPQRFQAESLALVQAVLAVRGQLPHAHYASGHNHYSMAMHLGSADTRLADAVLAFITEQAS